jgi:hypothetical protein
MRTHSLWVPALLTGLAVAGCTANDSRHADARYEQAKVETLSGDADLMSYRVKDFSAPNDHTLIIEGADGTHYRAETLGPCFGLGTAARLSFENRGGFQQIDRFSRVVLPDGTRCSFQNFSKIVSPETKALDSFERLGAQDAENGSTPR